MSECNPIATAHVNLWVDVLSSALAFEASVENRQYEMEFAGDEFTGPARIMVMNVLKSLQDDPSVPPLACAKAMEKVLERSLEVLRQGFSLLPQDEVRPNE